MWEVVYRKSVKKDLKNLSPEVQYVIRRAIEEKLMTDPVRFGVPLRRDLKGLMKLRVGDYRVIYSIERKQVVVYVVKIGHRKEVYDR
jgi:mRNA interferase RelE/StbE